MTYLILKELEEDETFADFIKKHPELLNYCKNCNHQMVFHFLKAGFFLRIKALGCKIPDCNCRKYA